MQTKISIVRDLWSNGDKIGALKIAAKFPQLGNEKRDITTAWAAVTNPGFYRQINKGPEELIETGLDAMREKYKLN